MQILDDDLSLMHRLADAAGDAIMPHFRQIAEVHSKQASGFDPVTVADRNAEAAMRALLERHRPDDGIVGEEFGIDREAASRRWILDPIDGTRAFIAGLPTWGILIALVVEGKARLGMMAQPFVRERFWTDGEASWLSRDGAVHRLATRRCDTLSEAVLLATSPDLFEAGDAERFSRLRGKVRMTRFGTDCYGFAMIAAGQADIVCEAGLQTYDIAPFIPLLAAAGGGVSDWSGGDALNGGRILAVGDEGLRDTILAMLA